MSGQKLINEMKIKITLYCYSFTFCDKMEIGDQMRIKANVNCKLSELAARDGMKQVDIHKITNASSKSQVGRWFHNQEVPHAVYLLRISKATGWTLEEMIEEE